MKIGIVSVYKTHNCGSFLQAYALKRILVDMNHDVYFVPYNMFANSLLDVLFQCFKSFLKCRFNFVNFMFRRYLAFRCLIKEHFQRSTSWKSCDLFIFGSDTLWNFEDPFFLQRKKFFLGNWTSKKKIAFSVSVGSSDYLKFLSDNVIVNGLKNFHQISVRDIYSLDFVKHLSKRDDLLETIDPTMLLKPEDYSFGNETMPKGGFVFVYHFGKCSDKLQKEITFFAANKQIRIINMGSPIAFADENVTNDPFKFLQYIKNADYVFTNTFHGCIFSILFNKQFVTDGFAKKKIETLLIKFRLEDRILYVDNEFTPKMELPIEYKSVNICIENYRKKSLAFLTDNLN